jgi:endonuclease-3
LRRGSGDLGLGARARIHRIIRLLESEYGIPHGRRSRDLLGSLIATILSQNTTSANAQQAFSTLQMRFPVWEDVATARLATIAASIRPAGLAPQRAPRIKKLVQRLVSEHGRASLAFLRKMDSRAAVSYLTSFSGVGRKTASCLLLFDMGRDAFPVDTHVARLARRLELVDRSASVDEIQDRLEELCPREKFLSLHLNLVRHGRLVCKARRPRCGSCVLERLCPAFRARLEGQAALNGE